MNSPYRINQNNVKKRQKKVKIDENVNHKGGSVDINRPQMIKKQNQKMF